MCREHWCVSKYLCVSVSVCVCVCLCVCVYVCVCVRGKVLFLPSLFHPSKPVAEVMTQ